VARQSARAGARAAGDTAVTPPHVPAPDEAFLDRLRRVGTRLLAFQLGAKPGAEALLRRAGHQMEVLAMYVGGRPARCGHPLP